MGPKRAGTTGSFNRICSVCRTPLLPTARQQDLCSSPGCTRTFTVYLGQQRNRCATCGVFLRPAELSQGQCHRAECRNASHIRDQFERQAAFRNALRQNAASLATTHAQASGTTLPDQHLPVLVPSISRVLEPLESSEVETFLNRLLARIEQNFTDYPDWPTELPEEDHGEELTGLAQDNIIRSCTVCQGYCCRYGRSEIAYLGTSAILRYRHRHPDAAPEDILANYAAHIPQETYAASCVYHGSHGCTLPQPLRSSTCNRYLCSGVQQMLVQLENQPETIGYVAATEGNQVLRVAPLQSNLSSD